MRIAVIGAGYVGAVTATCFAEFGNEVVCVDKMEEKVKAFSQGEPPFFEPGLKELLVSNLKQKRLFFTTDIDTAIRDALVVFLAVGTPPRGDGSTDISSIIEVAKIIARNLDGYKVIVTKSTVPVGTTYLIRDIIEENKKIGVSFDVASNPEFLREGSAIYDFMHPDRVVIGAESDSAIAILKDLYRPIYLRDTPFVFTDIKTAELIKYVCNSFLAMKISFINEVANICDIVGSDIHVVARAMGLDNRIGPKFLHPGPGFGGSCLPKDTLAMVKIAENIGYDFKLVKATIEVNNLQKERAVSKIVEVMEGDVRGKVIALWGLSFKPNTDDIRESPAVYIAKRLIELGAVVKAYDPAALENAVSEIDNPNFIPMEDMYDVLKGSDCLVIATEWSQFRNADIERIKGLLKKPIVVDLRNVYEPENMKKMGFIYRGMGRSLKE
ncbi:MAG: UDP-glucose dehydrogenase family protein [Thermosulfidibacteraceae bacterium]|jgi:UDPglucose 6-dehydrogenase